MDLKVFLSPAIRAGRSFVNFTMFSTVAFAGAGHASVVANAANLPTNAANTYKPASGITFQWIVNGSPVNAPAFVNIPGPSNSAAQNTMSRLQLTHELALVVYRRALPNMAVSLVEIGVWNDPLICTNQPGAGATIPSQTLPNLDITISGGSMYPLFPKLTSWHPVGNPQHFHLQLTDPTWAKIADGAGYVWPFLATTSAANPQFSDIVPLFPPNPGSIWSDVDPLYPSHTKQQLDELDTGGTYFPASGNPWDVMGPDVQYTPTTGYQPDWYWCHLGAYYARNDISDIQYVMPTVYRQAARPCHYYGFKDTGAQLFNMSRPAIWGTDFLGRVPTKQNDLYIAPVADTHGWWAYDHQHASTRRISEFALATGSPYAWSMMLHYGQLAKSMMRTVDPQPFGPGFANTPRGYLGWLEIAYRCARQDATYDMSVCIRSMEDFLDLGHIQIFGLPWGMPQVMWAQISDKWIPGHYAAASFEDLRAVPILLRAGYDYNRPKLMAGAIEKCQWYTTIGYTKGTEGLGVGIKRLVDPLNPSIFVDADLSGYNRVSALGLRLANQFLQCYPIPGFDAHLYLTVSDAIVADAKVQPDWSGDLSAWMMWR